MFNVTAKNKVAGFTLFEALIYIALFTLVIGGGVLSAYQIFGGQFRIQQMARNEAELNFVLRKLDWLASGEIVSANGAELIVNRDGLQYTVDLSDNTITLEDEPLSSLLNVSSLSFELSGGTPDILTIELTVDDEVIGPITRYVRTN